MHGHCLDANIPEIPKWLKVRNGFNFSARQWFRFVFSPIWFNTLINKDEKISHVLFEMAKTKMVLYNSIQKILDFPMITKRLNSNKKSRCSVISTILHFVYFFWFYVELSYVNAPKNYRRYSVTTKEWNSPFSFVLNEFSAYKIFPSFLWQVLSFWMLKVNSKFLFNTNHVLRLYAAILSAYHFVLNYFVKLLFHNNIPMNNILHFILPSFYTYKAISLRYHYEMAKRSSEITPSVKSIAGKFGTNKLKVIALW